MSIQELKALIVATSAYYGQRLDDHVVSMYAEDLADLPFDRVVAALKEVRRDPKTFRFPLPAVIRERIQPAENPEYLAIEAVSRIVAAVSNIGPYQVERARAFVGELGWEVVKADGGWENVCQVLSDDNIGVMRAQWKSLALTKIARARAGQTGAPELPSPDGGGKVLSLMHMREMPR